ncbi:hypothetical protein [Streptomyces sp. NPDC054940]
MSRCPVQVGLFNEDPVIKSSGFALAVGVLIDAFVDLPDRTAGKETETERSEVPVG